MCLIINLCATLNRMTVNLSGRIPEEDENAARGQKNKKTSKSKVRCAGFCALWFKSLAYRRPGFKYYCFQISPPRELPPTKTLKEATRPPAWCPRQKALERSLP